MKDNPRFLWNIGAMAEVYPDLPPQGIHTELWDRQEKKPVVTLYCDYQQAMCLEMADEKAFTHLQDWFNSLTNKALKSENLTPTKTHLFTRKDLLKEDRVCIHCGCDDGHACIGGCAWAVKHKATNTGVCTSCAKDHGIIEVFFRRKWTPVRYVANRNWDFNFSEPIKQIRFRKL